MSEETELRKAVRKLASEALAVCTDPNEVSGEIESVVEGEIEVWATEHGWFLWGDDCWREAGACSICGSYVAGICGHENDPNQVVLRGLEAIAKYKEVADAKARNTGAER